MPNDLVALRAFGWIKHNLEMQGCKLIGSLSEILDK